MTSPIDLAPATDRLGSLVRAVTDDDLARPTPCAGYLVGDLVDHIGGLAIAFAGAATKVVHDGPSPGPSGDASRLGVDWRSRIPRHLDALAQVWRDPGAWLGMTAVGAVDLPGEVAGRFALNEVVVHGWDLAVATGQPYRCDDDVVDVLIGLVEPFAAPEQHDARDGLFGPVVAVDPASSSFDRLLGLTGRDPSWTTAIDLRKAART